MNPQDDLEHGPDIASIPWALEMSNALAKVALLRVLTVHPTEESLHQENGPGLTNHGDHEMSMGLEVLPSYIKK